MRSPLLLRRRSELSRPPLRALAPELEARDDEDDELDERDEDDERDDEPDEREEPERDDELDDDERAELGRSVGAADREDEDCSAGRDAAPASRSFGVTDHECTPRPRTGTGHPPPTPVTPGRGRGDIRMVLT